MTTARKKTVIDFVNTYSVWVVLGSFVTFLFFSKLFDQDIDYIAAIGLALGVWFIYTLDHLLDGLKLGYNAVATRHRSHYRNRKSMVVLLVCVATIELCLIYYLNPVYYLVVTYLVILTVVHFIINFMVTNKYKSQLFLKEIFIAFVVTIGFVVAPTIISNTSLKFITAPFGTIFCINLANLLIFSLFDRQEDGQTKTLSAATFLLENQLILRILILLSVALILSWVTFINDLHSVWLLTVTDLMIISLIIIVLRRDYFKQNDRYRFYGDLIYLYPAIALPFL